MISPRSQFIELIVQGAIPAEKVADALKVAKITPDGEEWRRFVDRLLLWIGGLALAFAVMFFIAYNWYNFGRLVKFAMVEGVIIMSIVAYLRFGGQSASGKVSILFATICLGVLLALYGQTYQTGADPWQLFFSWALLMLPWAVVGRFSAIWIVWVALINTAIVLYYQTFRGIFWFVSGSETGMLWLTFIFNTLLLAVWEFLSGIWQWLSERWAIRLLAIGSGVPLTWLVLLSILTPKGGPLPGPAWVIWLALMYFIYRKKRPDLFMLAGCCLSVITVTVSFLGWHMLKSNSASAFFILTVLISAMGAGAAFWLKNVHKEFTS